MSGVSPSERKKQTDELRSFREEAQTREAEEAKRHKKEVKRLQASQNKEMDELKKAYDERIQDLRSKSSEIMSERDLANQAKIDKLRALYADSLKKKTEENETRRSAETDAYQQKLHQQKQTSAMQRENLERNFKDTLTEKDKQFERLSKNSTKEMQEAIQTRSDKLNEKHNREMDLMRQDRDNSNIQNSRDLSETKSVLGTQLKDTKRKAADDLENNDREWRNIYDSKMVEVDQIMTDKNENLQLAGKKMQKRYKEALDSKLQQLDGAHQSLKEQTAERISGDIRSLESENRMLKRTQMSELNKNRGQANIEKQHVIEAYEDRMKQLSESKNALLDRTKEVNIERIKDANARNNQIVQNVVTRSKSDQIISNERHKDDRAQMEVLHKAELQRINNKTDERYNKVLRSANESQKMQEKMRTENLAQLKDNYAAELSNQRQAQMEIMRDTRSNLDEKMKSIQNKYANKLDETVNNYENRLKDSEDRRLKQLNSQAKQFTQQIKNQERQFQGEMQSQEMKTDMRISQQQELHEKEIDRLERRHQEQMASLAQKLNYYRKG